jgi:hypothetical protein
MINDLAIYMFLAIVHEVFEFGRAESFTGSYDRNNPDSDPGATSLHDIKSHRVPILLLRKHTTLVIDLDFPRRMRLCSLGYLPSVLDFSVEVLPINLFFFSPFGKVQVPIQYLHSDEGLLSPRAPNLRIWSGT